MGTTINTLNHVMAERAAFPNRAAWRAHLAQQRRHGRPAGAMAAAIRQHPQFRALVNLEARRRRLVMLPGGAAELRRNADQCFAAEAAILRDTGCTVDELTSAVLPLAGE